MHVSIYWSIVSFSRALVNCDSTALDLRQFDSFDSLDASSKSALKCMPHLAYPCCMLLLLLLLPGTLRRRRCVLVQSANAIISRIPAIYDT